MQLVIFLIILSVLIIAHEFGHFLVARLNGVRVEKFAIGFGPVIFKKKIKFTDFIISLFPLGGYVKLAGDERKDFRGAKDEFLSQPISRRAGIIFAGPFFNYLLAFLVLWAVSLLGFPYLEPTVGALVEGYPAQKAGLKEKDRILEVNGKKIETWQEMTGLIYKSKGKVELKIQRDGQIFSLSVPLKEKEVLDDFGQKRSVSMIGISSDMSFKMRRYNLFTGFLKAGETLFNLSILILKSFLFIILGKLPFREAVAGPLGIYYVTSEAIKLGIVAALHLIANLSLSLAIVNLMPLPILDGGHLALLFLEKVRKKPLSVGVEEIITRVGLVFLAVLFIFIFYNDIVRFGTKIWIR